MEEKKVTRRMMVQAILDKNWELLATEEYQDVASRYAASMDKNASKPKEKTTARRQNERKMKEVYAAMVKKGTRVTPKWIVEHVNGIMSTQKLSWGVTKVVKEKKETYYELTGKEL